jgi:hypothetical protein
MTSICADTGYLNEKLILDIEDKTDTIVYCAVGKQQHYKTLDDLFDDNEPASPNQEASFKEVMTYRLKTAKGKARYKLRKQTVEPVFGIIKNVLGFREFRLRGIEKVGIEWELVKNAYNIKRLFNLTKAQLPVSL